jgi:hypothetical protein
MRTVLGTPYTPPTADEIESFVRQAHRERAEAMREAWSALFRWRRGANAEHPSTHTSLQPSL